MPSENPICVHLEISQCGRGLFGLCPQGTDQAYQASLPSFSTANTGTTIASCRGTSSTPRAPHWRFPARDHQEDQDRPRGHRFPALRRVHPAQLRQRHGVHEEMKWRNVSPSEAAFYADLVDLLVSFGLDLVISLLMDQTMIETVANSKRRCQIVAQNGDYP